MDRRRCAPRRPRIAADSYDGKIEFRPGVDDEPGFDLQDDRQSEEGAGYFNFQRRTMIEFFSDVKQKRWKPTLDNYLSWAKMRTDATDLLDVTGHAYTYLMNGLSPEGNWTGLFLPGERVRLRFIQVGVMTFQDVRIPGLKITVVQADGQNVQPVEVDEFRIGPAETYDVIVEPKNDRAYTIFAETLDRSGYARGTLVPRLGMRAAIPECRPRPLRTMKDMGMSMDKAGASGDQDMKNMPGMQKDPGGRDVKNMPGIQDKPAQRGSHGGDAQSISHANPRQRPVKHGPDHHGISNQAVPDETLPAWMILASSWKLLNDGYWCIPT